jgi:glycerol-1-phosphate dehydrogenase [NAD(P)+]
MIRNRYTVLDLANEAGVLEELVQELFAPGGHWARSGFAAVGAAGARLLGGATMAPGNPAR